LIFVVMAAGMAWGVSRGIFQSQNVKLGNPWLFLLTAFLSRKVVFDVALNKFRGLKTFYVTPEVKNVTGLWDAIRKGKFVDWLHYKAFGLNSQIYYPAYLLISIILTIIL